MKIIYKLLFLLFLMLGYSSCDFLNIVPDEITKLRKLSREPCIN